MHALGFAQEQDWHFPVHHFCFHDCAFVQKRNMDCAHLGTSVFEVIATLKLLCTDGDSYCPHLCGCGSSGYMSEELELLVHLGHLGHRSEA